ncbi:MAG: hypothetical protein AB1578_10860 [Thermodesulfobacteriota bacterium]
MGAFLDGAAGLCLELLRVGGQTVPVVVSDGVGRKAAIFSPRGHYLEYPIHEIARRSAWWSQGRLRAVLFPLSLLLGLGRIDRAVYVNHWLLVGGPTLRLDRDRLGELVEGLRLRYPSHALIFSGVVPALAPRLMQDLLALGGRAVQSRIVYLLDPGRSLGGRARKKVRGTRNADEALARANRHRRIDDPGLLAGRGARMRDLYAQLYLDKHAGELNPRYRAAFFELVLGSGIFCAAGWMGEDGALEAFNLHLADGGAIGWSLCGYDRSAPVSRGLFRLAAGEDVEAAKAGNRILNWGGGNGDFKRFRGAEPAFEYDLVFDGHLSVWRRVPWWVLQRGRAYKNRAPLVPSAGGGPP